jgi:hypothetical protein
MSEHSPILALDNWVCGEDQSFLWPVYMSDSNPTDEIDESDTLVDITGWTVEFRMALGKGGVSVLTKGASLEDPTHGLTRVSFASADTIDLAPRTYFYELWRTNVGNINRLAHGNAHLLPRVSTP